MSCYPKSHQVLNGTATSKTYFCVCAFENAFDKLFEIMEAEGWTDGGISIIETIYQQHLASVNNMIIGNNNIGA